MGRRETLKHVSVHPRKIAGDLVVKDYTFDTVDSGLLCRGELGGEVFAVDVLGRQWGVSSVETARNLDGRSCRETTDGVRILEWGRDGAEVKRSGSTQVQSNGTPPGSIRYNHSPWQLNQS